MRGHGRVGAAVLSVLLASACRLGPPPAWQLPPPPVRDAPLLEADRLHRETLENGLRVLVLEDPRLPRVVLGVTLRRGVGIESLELAGSAAFTAEMLGRGAGERDALELAETVDSLGASLDTAAGWDSTTVTLAGLSRDLEALLAILADVVLRPRFDPAEALKVRSESLAALERAKDDPRTLASWNIARLLYPGHRYGLPLQGTPESVSRLDAVQAAEFYRRVFVARNAILFVSGDVRSGELLPRLQAAFGAWAGGVVPDPGPAPPSPAPPERRILVVDRPDLGQAQIAIAHDGIARNDPARVEVNLMNTVLGSGGFSSRLMTRVRAEEGLTYGVYSFFSPHRHPGSFRIATFTRVPEVRRVVDLLLHELAGMRSNPPDGEEVRNAQSFSTGRFALQFETSPALLRALVELDVHGLPEDSLDTYRARVRAKSVEDVARAAQQRLHPERAAIVVVGPADALRPQLEDLGPVEVVTP
jgi:zinc protease